MPIKKDELRSCLITKFGFEADEGGKHEKVALIIDGRKIATTRFSRSQTDIGDQILSLIAKQIWVNLNYLKRMHGCSNSREDYITFLRNGGHL